MSKERDKKLNLQLFAQGLELGKLLASQVQIPPEETKDATEPKKRKKSHSVKEIPIEKLKQMYQKI